MQHELASRDTIPFPCFSSSIQHDRDWQESSVIEFMTTATLIWQVLLW